MRLSRLEKFLFAILVGVPGYAILRLAHARFGFLGIAIFGLIAAFVTLSPDWHSPTRAGAYPTDPVSPRKRQIRNPLLVVAKLVSVSIALIGFGGFYLVELGHCPEFSLCRAVAAYLGDPAS